MPATADERIDCFDEVMTGYYNKNWKSDATQDNAVDVMAGGDGNDLMYGKGGNDILSGDGGADAFKAIGEALTKYDPVTNEYSGLVDVLTHFANQNGYDENGKLLLNGPGKEWLHIEEAQNRIEQSIKGKAPDTWGKSTTPDEIADKLAEFEEQNDWNGDDYLNGGEGEDIIFAGGGNDLILYDESDYLVHGGSGDIDVLLSGKDDTLHLQDLLDNTASGKGPMVSEVEVLLKGDEVTTLTSWQELEQYGIKVDGDTLVLGKEWTPDAEGHYRYKDLVLETTLEGTRQEDGTIIFQKSPADTLDLTSMDTSACAGLNQEQGESGAPAGADAAPLAGGMDHDISPVSGITDDHANEEALRAAINNMQADTGGC